MENWLFFIGNGAKLLMGPKLGPLEKGRKSPVYLRAVLAHLAELMAQVRL